jgi:hypothetical protein
MVSQRRFISMLRHTDISRVVSLKCGGIHAVFFFVVITPCLNQSTFPFGLRPVSWQSQRSIWHGAAWLFIQHIL